MVSAFFPKIRYEVNFQNGIECGGAYVKLLSKTPELNLVSTFVYVATQFSFKNFRENERKFAKTCERSSFLLLKYLGS